MANEEAFKVGDVVRLKSGGPLMTIHYKGSDAQALGVTWFSGSGDVKKGEFPAGCLEKVGPEAKKTSSTMQSW